MRVTQGLGVNNKFHGLSSSGVHHSFLFDQGSPNNTKLQHHQANQNGAIGRYFVKMKLYLTMLFILLISLAANSTLIRYSKTVKNYQ